MSVKDILFSQTARRYHKETVEMPDGSKHDFWIRSLNTSERAKWLESRFDRNTGKSKPLADIQCSLIQKTLVECDGGELVLSPTERHALMDLDGGVVGTIYEAAFEFCRLAPRFTLDELGNSSETDDDDSKSE